MRKKRERVRISLTADEQDTCAKVIMNMQQEQRLQCLDTKVHDIARQALTLGLNALAKAWKVDQ